MDHVFDEEFAIAKFADFANVALFTAIFVESEGPVWQEVTPLFEALLAV